MAENTVPTTNEQNTAIAERTEQTHEPERYVSPAVDIYEKEDGLYIAADMPGLEQDHVELSVENDVLTLRGTPAKATVDEDYLYREYRPVGYFRQFRLGRKIDQSRVAAAYRNGVLNVSLPFAEEAKPRKITVAVN